MKNLQTWDLFETINESSWDSAWVSDDITINNVKVPTMVRVVYDTPHYISLQLFLVADEKFLTSIGIEAPNYLEARADDDYPGIEIFAGNKESSQIDVRSMSDSDVYDFFDTKIDAAIKKVTANPVAMLVKALKADGMHDFSDSKIIKKK